jgi:hypothetical protein
MLRIQLSKTGAAHAVSDLPHNVDTAREVLMTPKKRVIFYRGSPIEEETVMKQKVPFIAIVLAVSVFLIASGCAKKSAKVGAKAAAEKTVENGVGKARNFDDALDLAFRDALKKVVVAIIGEEQEKQNEEKLKGYVYSISQSFVTKYEVTDKVKSDRDTIVYVKAEFNRSKVEESIKTLGISVLEKEAEKDYSKSPYAGVINEALDNLTYLVYFEPQKRNIEDEYARLCVSRVNNYLANKGYEYVDFEQITAVKDDYLKVYEETQGSVSVVQLIAQALNADVYIVVDGIVEDGGKEGNINFASASIDLKAFESATGRGLGTETGYSGRLGLTSGMDAARRKTVEVAVEKATEPVINLSRDYMLKAFEQGIRYEVVVQGVEGYRMLQDFTDVIRKTKNFRSLKEVSAAAGQAKYYVYYMGRKTELIDDVLAGIKGASEFENLTVVVSRGNAVIFGIEE